MEGEKFGLCVWCLIRFLPATGGAREKEARRWSEEIYYHYKDVIELLLSSYQVRLGEIKMDPNLSNIPPFVNILCKDIKYEVFGINSIEIGCKKCYE